MSEKTMNTAGYWLNEGNHVVEITDVEKGRQNSGQEHWRFTMQNEDWE